MTNLRDYIHDMIMAADRAGQDYEKDEIDKDEHDYLLQDLEDEYVETIKERLVG